MSIKQFFAIAILTASVLCAERPNIILVMVDDMGFSDIGCYGGEIQTPNIDSLAANGIRFTQFYNTGRCCPTRASLLTGLYPHQAGVGHMMQDRGTDGYRGDLNDRCVTIAEVLKKSGYATFMSGKWHITRFTKDDGPKHSWPRQRGFDRFFGTITGAGSFYTPSTLSQDNAAFQPDEGFFYTHAINDRATGFIKEHLKANASQPFFCYVAHTAPHWPLHALKEDIAKYRGKYKKGWDVLRQERHARQVEMGIVSKDWAITERDKSAPAWETLDESKRDELDLRMAIYAAQIDCVDQGLGRMISMLRNSGQLDNTLIFFLADNGGCAEGGLFGFERNRNGVLGEDSSFASYGLCWANASNTPFRRYKHYVHEGGIATPLIVHWPAGIQAKDELRTEPGHLIDIMATCVDVSSASYPTRVKDNPIHPMEGRSLKPVFENQPLKRDAIYWEHEGNRAIRIGKWKLVATGRNSPWELYDLDADRTETMDLASKMPDRVTDMGNLWTTWAERTLVLPWPGSNKPRAKKLSKANTFKLKQGDQLFSEGREPAVGRRSIRITATLESAPKNGVILAQGGSTHGYALYIRDGKLELATRRSSKLGLLTTTKDIPAGKVLVGATIGKDGTLTISINGEAVATGTSAGPLTEQPQDGLEVGEDLKGLVGRYVDSNKFDGTIESVTLEVGK